MSDGNGNSSGGGKGSPAGGGYPQQAVYQPVPAGGGYPQQAVYQPVPAGGGYSQQAVYQPVPTGGGYPQQAVYQPVPAGGGHPQQAGATPNLMPNEAPLAAGAPRHGRRLWGLLAAGSLLFLGIAAGTLAYLWRSTSLFSPSSLPLPPPSNPYVSKVLVEKELPPNPQRAVVVDVPGAGRIVLPGGTLETKATLRVAEVTGLTSPPQATLGRTLDVSLGNQHDFGMPLVVEVPYALASVSGRLGKHPQVMALSHNPTNKTWDHVPFSIDEKRSVLQLTTTHLSLFSAVSPSPIAVSPTASIAFAVYPYAGAFSDAATAERILKGSLAEASKVGWKIGSEWLGIGQALGALGEGAAKMCEYDNAASVLGSINDVATNLGVAFALVQFGIDMSKPDHEVIAVGNALKAIGADALGRWGTSAIKLAGVGVFALDYSLGEFANTAWSLRTDMWSKAFACYYARHRRTPTQWFYRLKEITDRSGDPAAMSAAIQAEVQGYATEYFRLRTSEPDCQAVKFGGEAGLNPTIEKQISREYAGQLYADLAPVFAQLSRRVDLEQRERAHQRLEELRTRLNQRTTIHVVLKSKNPATKLGGHAVAISVGRQPELWRGTSGDDGVFDMRVTSLGYMMYGAPTEVVVTVPPATPSVAPTIRQQTFKYVPGTTVVEVSLDEDKGLFKGELNGTHKAPGIDNVVVMKGPIQFRVDESGRVTGKFSLPLKFTSGRGQATVTTNSVGAFTGTLEGAVLSGKGTVDNQSTTVIRTPGKDITQSSRNSAAFRVEGTLVDATHVEGKLKPSTPGSTEVSFRATRQ